ncbi:hypothetical protein DFJ74DRAFT_666459 [Hyaloraphidium curvatum]|nr:hypothetical protein DFJ74DRAFT_666459 [Hyaloraphidium curvatum]
MSNGAPAEMETVGAAAAGATNGVSQRPVLQPAATEKVDLVEETYAVTSVSTAHGVWRIFDRKRSLANRLCWLLLWLAAVALFITYFVLQTQYLVSDPTSTLITQEFVSPTPFPAVSVCLSTLDPDSVRSFVNVVSGISPEEQLVNLFNSSGILCFYGNRTPRQLANSDYVTGSERCRSDGQLSFIDYPFASSPTLCFTTPANGSIAATQPGYSMIVVGRLPGLATFDSITYAIRKPEEQYSPLLANLLTLELTTRVRFSISRSTIINNCDSRPGGQSRCFATFQQSCIEQACSCSYPTINTTNGADLPSQLPGSCASKNLNGTCNFTQYPYPCRPPYSGSNCTLLQACGPEAAKAACPLPSCEEYEFPQTASTKPITAAMLNATVNGAQINGTAAVDGTFILSVVLNDQMVTRIDETHAYTPLTYFGSVGGMMGLLLGFSVLTILEWIEGCWIIGKRVERAATSDQVDLQFVADEEKGGKGA